MDVITLVMFCNLKMKFTNNLYLLLLISYTIVSYVESYEYSGLGEIDDFSSEFGWEGSGDGNFDCDLQNYCEQLCFNIDDSQYCFCQRGYKLNEDKQTCSDINECLYENGGCSHVCVNKVGSYLCACEVGFARGGDGLSCNDINECEEGIDSCEQTCFNEIGGYRCGCTEGYVSIGNNTNCIPDLAEPITADDLTLIFGSVLIFVCVLGIIAFAVATCSTVSLITSKSPQQVVHLERALASL